MARPAKSLTLAIETSNPSSSRLGASAHSVYAGSVALGRVDPGAPHGFALLGVERLRSTARHDDALMPAIARLCRRLAVEPRDLGRIAVSIGPGGFTGLRIAVTTAKLLSEAAGAETIGVPSACVVALKHRRLGRFAVSLAAKRDSAWITIFDRDPVAPGAAGAVNIPNGHLWTADDVRSSHAIAPLAALVADEHTPPAIMEWARAASIRIVRPWFCATRCLEASVRLASVDPLQLAPLYPREPEAVSKWRELRRGV